MSHTLQRKHKSRKRKGLAGSCNTNKTEPTGAEGLLTSQAHPTSRPGSLEHLNCALCCPLSQDVWPPLCSSITGPAASSLDLTVT